MTCPQCKKQGTTLDVRGRIMCLKCHIEFIWDYAEGTRRMAESPTLNTPNDLHSRLMKEREMKLK